MIVEVGIWVLAFGILSSVMLEIGLMALQCLNFLISEIRLLILSLKEPKFSWGKAWISLLPEPDFQCYRIQLPFSLYYNSLCYWYNWPLGYVAHHCLSTF